jgi:hypothetical protein
MAYATHDDSAAYPSPMLVFDKRKPPHCLTLGMKRSAWSLHLVADDICLCYLDPDTGAAV